MTITEIDNSNIDSKQALVMMTMDTQSTIIWRERERDRGKKEKKKGVWEKESKQFNLEHANKKLLIKPGASREYF